MKHSMSMALAAGFAACIGSAAMADFHIGQTVSVSGTASGFGEVLGWGSNQGQGPHTLGGSTQFVDSVYGPPYFVNVNSVVNNINFLTLIVDLTQFLPTGYLLTIEVPDLKADGSISSVFASWGTVTVNPDGNGFTWASTGTQHPVPPVVTFEITQIPTPGAAAVLGLGGLMAARRRR